MRTPPVMGEYNPIELAGKEYRKVSSRQNASRLPPRSTRGPLPHCYRRKVGRADHQAIRTVIRSRVANAGAAAASGARVLTYRVSALRAV